MTRLLLVAALACVACKDQQSKPATPPTPVAETPVPTADVASPADAAAPSPVLPENAAELARSSNRFALALWSRAGSGDLAMSPASLATALAIAWGGAKGETAAQMKKVLNIEGEPDAVLSRWGQLSQALQDPSRGLTLKLANRLYGEKTYPFDTTYFTIIRKAFDVWIEPVDFVNDADATRQNINAWVAERTEQRIKDLLPPPAVTKETRMVIVNAIYFLADWARPFSPEATHSGDFYADGKTKKSVPTMRQQHAFRHASADGAALLELPYKGDNASMYILLPDQRDGLAALEKQLDSKLKALQSKLTEASVEVFLPRFTIEPAEPMPLANVLKSLGMTDAFDPNKADFTNIAKPKNERDKLVLSEVLHKAFVKVDEKGTEAAAATAALARAGAAAPLNRVEFRADHPFLFVIADRPSGVILFLGRVVDPS